MIAIATAVTLVIGIVAFGRRADGYDHRARTISELGEVGARDQHVVAIWFGLVGLGLAVVAATASAGPARLLAGSLAVGYLVAAAFPCDAGCPPRGTTRNSIHLAGGVAEYVGAVAGLFWLGSSEPFYLIPGVIASVAIVAMSREPEGHVGLLQRITEAVLFGSLIAAT